MINQDTSDAIRGCLLAGAIGDAMGGPYEGQPGPIQFVEHSAGTVSDDTQLTLATCEALIEAGKASPEHIAARFLAWFRAGRVTGVGASTLKALNDLDAGAHWALAGAKGEMRAGNGAAMRIAPLAFFVDPREYEDRRVIRDVCRITHHNEESYVGALAMLAAIHCGSVHDVIHEVVELLPDSRVRDRLIQLEALPRDTALAEVASEFGSSAYVAESVPLAIYAARRSESASLWEVLRSVVEAGGDTDTTASMAGHIVGAWRGASQIPATASARLPMLDLANSIAKGLADVLVKGT